MYYLIRYVILPFVATLLSSWILTYLVRGLTEATGMLDKPGQHKQHETPTPTLGGLSVFLSFIVGCTLSGPMSSHLLTILYTSAGLVLVGLLDDLRGVSANKKLAALGCAAFFLWKDGIHLNVFGSTGIVALLLTFLWIGLISSAFNGVDNADGAAGGLAVISCTATFAISWVSWQHDLAVISSLLAASCLGFLAFNYPRPRATIFLGDSGSLFLGFGLSVLAILGEWSSEGWKSALIAFLLVSVPLADFCFILLSRGLDGRYKRWDDPIKMCARDHTFHRLRALGLGPKASLWCMYCMALLSGLLAFLAVIRPELITPVRILQWVGVFIVFYLALKQVQLPPDAFPEN